MDFPALYGITYMDGGGAVLTTSAGTIITASSVANTKGAWVIVSSSSAAARRCSWLDITMGDRASGIRDYLVDVAVGVAGSEQTIAANLYCGTGSAIPGNAQYSFPISVPASKTISARIQATTASATMPIILGLSGGGVLEGPPLSRITAIGAKTSNSGLTPIDPGGSANTKGAFAALTSSLTNNVKYMIVAIGNKANNATSLADWLIDIAIGAAGSEQVVIPNLFHRTVATAGTVGDPQTYAVPITIPKGTAVSARAQCSSIDATDRLRDIAIYGVD